MKSKAIQRDIRSRHSRVPGNSPGLAGTTRLHDTQFPEGDRRSRRRGTGQRYDLQNSSYRKSILLWSCILGAAALAIIGTAVSLWIAPQLGRHSGTISATSIEPETYVRVESGLTAPSESEAVRLVKRAISNRDPATVSSLFRMGSANAFEVIDFFKASAARDGEIERYEWLSSVDVDDLRLEGVQVFYKGKEKPTQRLAFLTPDDHGVWKLDFDAFARSVKPSWNVLLTKETGRGTVRVFVARDYYFNGPFSDETEWVCYGLASPDVDELLRGYCKVGSPEAAAMEKLFSDEVKMSRATLEIRHPKEGESRQFEITRILAEGWVLPDSPDRNS